MKQREFHMPSSGEKTFLFIYLFFVEPRAKGDSKQNTGLFLFPIAVNSQSHYVDFRSNALCAFGHQ